ncbi:hypothetical protein JCM5353_005935 [Sporobolomyces roseus]
MSGSEWDDDDPQMTMYRLAASRLGHIKADGNPVTADEILTTRRLHSQLREQREEIWNDEDAVERTLYGDPFILLPAISRHPSQYTEQMRDWIFKTSSEREVIVILEEELSELKISKGEESDEEGISEEEEEVRDVRRTPGRDPKVDQALETFKMYVKNYRSALRRIGGTDKFYITAYQSLSSVLTHLVVKGDFAQPDKRWPNTSVELELLASLLGLAFDIEETRMTDQKEDESQRSARSLVETAFGHLGPMMSIDKAGKYFYSLHPRYKLPNATSPRNDWTKHEQKLDIWRSFRDKGFDELNYDLKRLLESCRRGESLLQRIGSFSILSHYIYFVESYEETLDPSPERQRFLLSSVLDTISKSLDPGCPYKIAEDDILYYLWWCVSQPKTEEGVEEGYDEDILYSLIPILSSLSAFSPNPQTRFLSFQLLTTLVLSHTGTSPASEVTQLELLKDLISEEGTPSFKTACIGIVKEVLRGKFEKVDQDPEHHSIFLSNQCIEELGPLLLRFDPPRLLDNEELKPEVFVEENSRDVLQKLNWYYFVLQRDVKNKTGTRSPSSINTIDEHFILPLRSTLSKWLDSATSSSSPLDPSLQLELELLQTTLTRIDEVLKNL